MSRSTRTLLWACAIIVAFVSILVLLPSLLGILLVMLLVFALFDLAGGRYRMSVRTLNTSLRAVCHQEGAIEKVAVAFSRSGPVSGPCSEYAQRLSAGEEAVSAAISSGIPLQLSTAIALTTSHPDSERPARDDEDEQYESSISSIASELEVLDSTRMPVYGQFVYLTITAIVTCLVMAFMAIFFVPTIDSMLDEFGISAPVRRVFDYAPAIWLLLMLGVLLMIGIPILSRIRWFGLRPKWMPMTPSLAQRRAELLVGLADGIDSGWPIGRTLLAQSMSFDIP
jgi:hypothetical protein